MIDLPPFCPCCGANITVDTPVVRGRWELHLDRAFIDGMPIRMTGGEYAILYSLARAWPRAVAYWALASRVSDAQDLRKMIQVRVCQMRKKYGPRLPIEAVRGLGYRWRDRPAIDPAGI